MPISRRRPCAKLKNMYIDIKCRFCGKVFSCDVNKEITDKCPGCGTIISSNDIFLANEAAKSFFNYICRTDGVDLLGIYTRK